ncbi:MAG TPA: primosomal protein N' [Candidatus Omnitrophota bacterium]|nr:primosomal protein N' [Candidatus Omnitrophota bacterium]HPD84124.1 primosomal protein N' [Candidatus Omnitrophota bacterium]HRZ02981.1 primosomal protein N' [Candidatus Omnitrophota bacterium]
MNSKIVQVVVGLPVEGPFDYFTEGALADKIAIGQRAWVPFGPRKLVGFIVGVAAKSKFKRLKPIFSLIDNEPVLDSRLLALTQEISRHYGCSWGEAIEMSLPDALRKGKAVDIPPLDSSSILSQGNPETILVHDKSNKKYWPFLLENMRDTLSLGKGILFIVPENSLTDELKNKIKSETAEEIVVLDKRLKSGDELKEWQKVKGGQAKIIIGTRSAIFAPARNLGLIVVLDEDHAAYKQEQSPFYHLRDVALMRSVIENCRMIFVSAVPSAEVWQQVSSKKIKLVALEADSTSRVQIIDVSDFHFRKSSVFSFPLRNGIEKTLEARGKIVLFMNRKGFSTLTRCRQCGYTVKCRRCDTNLVYLFDRKIMVCRYCHFTANPPSVCPQCQSSYIRYSGLGIEKLESEISRIFPKARVCHYDRDTHSFPSDFDILIATQAVLRIQDKLFVDLVGAVQIDSELNRPDFRAAQKTFALLVHLKNLAKEKLIIQTRNPDNYCLKAILKSDFNKFYKKELSLRKELGLPPFKHFIAIVIRTAKEALAGEQAQELYKVLKENSKAVEILEPQPDKTVKLRGKYRWVILMKSKSVIKMMGLAHKALKTFRKKAGVVVSVDVDP